MAELVIEEKKSDGLPLSRKIGLILGPAFLIATLLLPAPETMPREAWLTLGMLLLMATWWATEAIPIPATALLPICLVPALGLGSITDATTPYSNPIIFLFIGGFMLGLAMQRWNLHIRIALLTLLAVGNKPSRQIGGVMLATAALGMWVSNTATAIMMLPIGLSIISMLKCDKPEEVRRFASAILLAIAYSSSVGGMATLIGTPPNALLAAYLLETHGIQVGFAQWMLIGMPISIVLQLFIWWWLTRGGFNLGEQTDSSSILRQQLHDLGPLSTGEKRTAMIVVLTASAWISQPLTVGFAPWLSDALIAVTASIVMFLVPVNLKKREFVMDWEGTRDMPWGVLLLFGGGLALAAIITRSGLATWIATSLSGVGVLPTILLIGLVVSAINLLTEITSNTATAATFLPLMGALAVSMGVSPILLAIPTTLAASCAFMMPVATPPNAIVFASGKIHISEMIRTGFMLSLFSILTITLLGYVLMAWAFGL